MRHPDPHFGYPTVSWRTKEQRPGAPAMPLPRHGFLRQGTLVLDTHVDAIDQNTPLLRIEKAWDELNQRTFASTGGTY